jgi:hypothetical protein
MKYIKVWNTLTNDVLQNVPNKTHSVGHTYASRNGKNDNIGVFIHVDTNCKIMSKEYVSKGSKVVLKCPCKILFFF